ncbi:hypothetical protein Poli38472_001826 [Pythium oligandrum]|uniref:Uncharacterized protein n=1 Tax=Pythium oligandrum TaxID=41045 RepID=A0A8K1CU58_PYTOL|nr:hypothetical protein Poli38472_001826 [Pythium oligandrum]|eukprot:TMW69670.1 hypothetical protein Poli38472_001826 [Pythium oligandrum]
MAKSKMTKRKTTRGYPRKPKMRQKLVDKMMSEGGMRDDFQHDMHIIEINGIDTGVWAVYKQWVCSLPKIDLFITAK